MKTVYTDNSEIAHLWASQAQDEAKNPQRNFYFRGKTIYSYGSHFPIAQIWNKDENIVFINSNSYSVTTSGHQGIVRYAVNHKKCFHVPEVEINHSFVDHKINLNYYLGKIETLTNKQSKARKYDYRPELNGVLQEFKEYVDLFHLRSMLLKAEKELLTLENADQIFKGCDFTALRIKKAKQATAKQTREAKKWLFGWLGCKVPYKANKVYLRVAKMYGTEDCIETSKGANVPLREAKILYDRIMAGKDIKGFKIGCYTAIGINGTLKIGCHEIERDEIHRIAKLLNWE